jgi:hypothetical protein
MRFTPGLWGLFQALRLRHAIKNSEAGLDMMPLRARSPLWTDDSDDWELTVVADDPDFGARVAAFQRPGMLVGVWFPDRRSRHPTDALMVGDHTFGTITPEDRERLSPLIDFYSGRRRLLGAAAEIRRDDSTGAYSAVVLLPTKFRTDNVD